MEYLPHAQELLEAIISFRRVFRSKKSRDDLNLNEVRVLSTLIERKVNTEEDDLIQVKDLSNITEFTQPYLIKIINSLEDKGLVERIRKTGDRKSVYVKLSRKGYDIYLEKKEKITALMNSIVTKLGKEDTQALIKLITRLTQVMEEE